jgi:hypothetical protein
VQYQEPADPIVVECPTLGAAEEMAHTILVANEADDVTIEVAFA